MPKKPSSAVIDAAKAKLDPKAVLQVVIQENPELREALLNKGLIEEVKDA